MEAILETIEIMGDRQIMKSIKDYESGKIKPKAFDVNEI